ncbi:MAG TPA: PstS family phosphate ABC transporter substrate-binding protein [Mycobacteriales bacterium]|nr:PstS family phosphate ABC transporter substrate-binding protein [Mycobacteriales bacterium]
MLFQNTRARLACAAVGLALVATACGGETTGSGDDLSGTIRVDGSSTVAPLSEAAAELFREDNSAVQVTVGTSGTGGGFEKFCAGEIDISDASRPIKDKEKAACEAKGVVFEELVVANDGLSLVVNKENTWAECLTVDQLKKIWEPKSKVNNWNQVDAKFPNVPLKLFGAGTDSGTFDYFTKEINGEEGASRTDYNTTEDDNVTVQGVSGDKGGLGYFGLSYFEENEAKLKAVQVDGGAGCVAPSRETVQDGTYKPLARPLYIYPTATLLARPEGVAFVEFFASNANEIAEEARFVPLTDVQVTELKAKIDALKSKSGATPAAT